MVLRISVDCAVVTSSEKMSPKGGAQESLLPPSFILTPLHMRCGLCVSVCVCVLNAVQLFETPWTVASLSLGFPRQQYWSRLLFPPPGVLPNPGKNLCLLHWQADSLPLRYLGSTGFLLPVATMLPALPERHKEGTPYCHFFTVCSHRNLR